MRFSVNDQAQVYSELWIPMQRRLGDNLTEFMRHYLPTNSSEFFYRLPEISPRWIQLRGSGNTRVPARQVDDGHRMTNSIVSG